VEAAIVEVGVVGVEAVAAAVGVEAEVEAV
jgi:hypothetical protein